MSAQAKEREFIFSDENFKFLATLVGEKTGIVLTPNKKNMVYARVVRRIRALKLHSFQEYCDFLSADSSGEELINFVNAITTNVTHFFREKHHFEHLENTVVPEILEAGGRGRFWSAGSSVGMEAYSIAMTLANAIPEIAKTDIKILATDIDTNVLKKGEAGVYDSEALKNIPSLYQKKYVSLDADQKSFQIDNNLRELVSFKRLNFLENWPVRGPFDAIFCRNVVIYFSKDTQRTIFNHFADLLKPGGWLYIGHSENLFNVSTRFKLIGSTIYRKIQ